MDRRRRPAGRAGALRQPTTPARPIGRATASSRRRPGFAGVGYGFRDHGPGFRVQGSARLMWSRAMVAHHYRELEILAARQRKPPRRQRPRTKRHKEFSARTLNPEP